MMETSATTRDFEKLDIRVGQLFDRQPFPEERYATHILMLDFGPELMAGRFSPS